MTAAIPGTSLLDPASVEDPYPFYGRLRREAPVWRIPGTEVFTVSTFELLAEAANRVEDFSSRINCLLYRGEDGLPLRMPYGDTGGTGEQALAAADPPRHTVHRKAVFPELVAKRMTALEPDIADLASAHVQQAVAQGTCDFMAAVGNVIPITMIGRLIGFRDSNVDQLFAAACDSTAMLSATLSYDQVIERMIRSAEIQVWLTGQLAQASEQSPDELPDTLLSTVARATADGVFSSMDANIVLHTLLSAGGETTSSLLGNAVRMLAEDPVLQAHLRSNPDAVPAFVEEALRLESPFRFLMRSVPADTTLGGVYIPAGSTMLLLFGAANRDPVEFERPDEIDLTRAAPRHHVAFGRGIHHCVGAHLARIEGRTVITTLLESTADIALDPARSPVWANSLMVRRHDQLSLVLTPASS